MWTYSTNIMGPYGLCWFEQNNIPYTSKITNNRFTDFKDVEYKTYEQWYGGRIDCYCSTIEDPDYDHHKPELGLPIMSTESLGKFQEYLETFKSCRLLEFGELKYIFESVSNYKLNIFKE